MRRLRLCALALALAGCGGDTGTQPSPEGDPHSSGGSTVVFLRVTLIVQNGVVSGAHHRLILANAAGGDEQQLIPDDRHTPTLEYFDW